MTGLGPELKHMESFGDTNVNVDSANNNMAGDASLMHFPANSNWPMAAAPGLNTATSTQLTILFNGNTYAYDGISAEKVQEIMLIAAAYAKSAEMKVGTQSSFTPLIPATPSSPQGNSNNLASQKSASFPAPEKSSICRRIQEFPLARRHSLQRFLEKRQFRLGSRGPFGSSPKKVDANFDNNFCDNNSLKRSEEGFQASIAAS